MLGGTGEEDEAVLAVGMDCTGALEILIVDSASELREDTERLRNRDGTGSDVGKCGNSGEMRREGRREMLTDIDWSLVGAEDETWQMV